jgi:hypothetical protein
VGLSGKSSAVVGLSKEKSCAALFDASARAFNGVVSDVVMCIFAEVLLASAMFASALAASLAI